MPRFIEHIMLDDKTALIRTNDGYVYKEITGGAATFFPGEWMEFAFQRKIPQFCSICYSGAVYSVFASTDEYCALAGADLLLFDRRRRAVQSVLQLSAPAASLCFLQEYLVVGFASGAVLMLLTTDFAQQLEFKLPGAPRQLFSYTNMLIALLVTGELVFVEDFRITRVVKTDTPLKQISVAPYLEESELRILGLSWEGLLYYIDERGIRMIPTVEKLVSIDTYVVGILTGMDVVGGIYLIDVNIE